MRALLSLFALGLLIFAHELGHLVVARILGIRASHVVFGFGPPLYTFRRRGLRVTLGAIPLGGTVELAGENPHRVDTEKVPRGYSAQAPWKRLLVLLGGPITNFAVAPAALFLLYCTGTHVPVPMTVGLVIPGSEAAYAQLRPGDRVLSLDGQAVSTWTELTRRLSDGRGREVLIEVQRHDATATARVQPRPAPDGTVRIGISQQYVYRILPPREAARKAFDHTLILARDELELAVKLVRGAKEVGLGDAGHVVRQAEEAAAAGGMDSALRAVAGLSVALGLFYLIPIPALDGGRIILVLAEGLTKRRVGPRLLTLLQTLGLLLLLALLVWVAVTNFRHLLRLSR